MKKKYYFQRKRLSLEELEEYYRERRKGRFEKGKPVRGVRLRKFLRPIMNKIAASLNKEPLKADVLKDERIPTRKPIVFAASHIGWDDIEAIFKAIDSHAYLFWGDPRDSYRRPEGVLLDINGAVICDTHNKYDRHIGKETCVELLSRGVNLLIFPEGAWNLTENLPIMGLFSGAAEMAIRSGADIVPVAIEQYGKDFRLRIGKNIDASAWKLEQKIELTCFLRDTLATLKWEVWESEPVAQRDSMPKNCGELYTKFLEDQLHNVYTLDDIRADFYRPKGITPPEEAYAHLKTLIPKPENAFLFRK